MQLSSLAPLSSVHHAFEQPVHARPTLQLSRNTLHPVDHGLVVHPRALPSTVILSLSIPPPLSSHLHQHHGTSTSPAHPRRPEAGPRRLVRRPGCVPPLLLLLVVLPTPHRLTSSLARPQASKPSPFSASPSSSSASAAPSPSRASRASTRSSRSSPGPSRAPATPSTRPRPRATQTSSSGPPSAARAGASSAGRTMASSAARLERCVLLSLPFVERMLVQPRACSARFIRSSVTRPSYVDETRRILAPSFTLTLPPPPRPRTARPPRRPPAARAPDPARDRGLLARDGRRRLLALRRRARRARRRAGRARERRRQGRAERLVKRRARRGGLIRSADIESCVVFACTRPCESESKSERKSVRASEQQVVRLAVGGPDRAGATGSTATVCATGCSALGASAQLQRGRRRCSSSASVSRTARCGRGRRAIEGPRSLERK